jgi:uncharacterized protein YabE (DUF348 family)
LFATAWTVPAQWAARVTVLATLLTGTLTYVNLSKTLVIDVDGYKQSVNIVGRTVADALSAAQVDLSSGDTVFPSVHATLDDGDQITVRTAKEVEIEIDGDRQVLTTTAATVGDVLDELGTRAFGAEASASRNSRVGRDLLKIQTLKNISLSIDGAVMHTTTSLSTVREVLLDLEVVLNEGDIVSAELDEQVHADQEIVVSRGGNSSDTITETLPFETIEKQDPNLIKGEKVVLQKGRAGQAVTTYDVSTLDGAEADRKVLVRTVLTEPQDEIIGIGTLDVADPSVKVLSPNEARALAKSMVANKGWSESEYNCLNNLWTKESNWRVTAENRSSGAYGIPQSLPGTKMASVAADWRTNAKTQITWGLQYIQGRYSTPCGAWAHSQRKGWY